MKDYSPVSKFIDVLYLALAQEPHRLDSNLLINK
jgi:hypothetical protein